MNYDRHSKPRLDSWGRIIEIRTEIDGTFDQCHPASKSMQAVFLSNMNVLLPDVDILVLQLGALDIVLWPPGKVEGTGSRHPINWPAPPS